MTATVTIDGREIVVTPTGRDALLWLRAIGGSGAEDVWRVHPAARTRLEETGLVDYYYDRSDLVSMYKLTPAGYEACAQLAAGRTS